jgi:transposase
VYLDLEPSKEFYKLLARGSKLALHAKIKLDRKNRRVIFHLSLEKEAKIYKPGNIKPIDVNKNSVATLYEASTVILETDLAKTTLGYSYRKESIRGETDLVAERLERLWRSLGRGEKKRYYRMKTANIIVRDTLRMRGVIAIERISGGIGYIRMH